jgi:hypothetical protein
MRFVILEHDHPTLHWDLMLDAGDALQTWRLDAPPISGGIIEATQLGDHRRDYLDYEGPVSGNRGHVKRWDAGEYADEPGSSADRRLLRLQGERVRGSFRLVRMEGSRWQLTPS